ncbi:UDP-N-acetylmuramate dehydrogenase [Clostridium sp. BJN0001]|uniref:UDP-N-acetylmuramate dehydrogenase n=1 Tax=Clostridium sp. BJN0001 TaxID=2930219 RepID=UPI001FD6168C|nr:UDP-N-acetylmuramate dehydrogenase [Clostridium sp. BJN0001]
MNQYKKYMDLFNIIYEKSQIKVDEPMKDHINFNVGGPADILLVPHNVEQIKKTISVCKKNNIPFYVIGNGSNILVKDGGVRGVIIELTRLNKITLTSENDIKAECGALLKDVSEKAENESLTGFEFACGIPGSVGGAVFMNAGAYNGEISNVIKEVTVLDDKNNIITITSDSLELGYRTSVIMKRGYIVLDAVFKLEKGDKEKITARIKDLTRRREEKQPLEYPSAGSTFKRPEGHFAGKLIQDSGLKGYAVGGACVSEKHAGFVINKNNATASDVLNVIKHVQEEVKKNFNVDLYPEVRIIGED